MRPPVRRESETAFGNRLLSSGERPVRLKHPYERTFMRRYQIAMLVMTALLIASLIGGKRWV